MFQYFAYGLGIHSELILPEFIQKDSCCDVTVTVQNADTTYLDIAEPRKYLKVSPQETIVAIQGIGQFQVQKGCEIIVTPSVNPDIRLIQLCIAGSIIATLLYQRGYSTILHASAIALHDQVVCFLGNSGDGKSSMAAALIAQGHQIVSDDVVPLIVETDAVKVVPAYPQIKMGPAIATALGYDLDQLIFLHPRLGEYAYRSETDFDPSPLRLTRIYILNDSEALSVEPLTLQSAMLELIRHTYGLQPLAAAIDRKRHFRQCTELLQQVSVCRLNRPRSIPLLPEVVRLIEADVLGTAQLAL
ncbi:MAG: hypothetical protein WCD18_08015 [Thermosynechococcaceae cyanobacterium]